MRSVEQEYRRLNETVVPDAQLIKETRALMLEEFSVEKVQARAKKRLMKKVASYVAVAAASALICVGVMTTLPRAKSEAEAPHDSAAMEALWRKNSSKNPFWKMLKWRNLRQKKP